LIVEENCILFVHDSAFRAVGIAFAEYDGELTGLHNGDYFAGHTFDWPGRHVRFDDVDVETWNFYATDSARVTVRDCLFGEALVFGHGTMVVRDSTCDGTGGYLGTRDSGWMDLRDTDLLCEVTCDGTSLLDVEAALITGTVTAAGDSLIHLRGCDIQGDLIELENGEIIVD